MTKPGRTASPCGWCGRSTLSPDAVCSLCVTIDRHATDVPDWTDALYGGDWRLDPVRRIQVWVPWEASA